MNSAQNLSISIFVSIEKPANRVTKVRVRCEPRSKVSSHVAETHDQHSGNANSPECPTHYDLLLQVAPTGETEKTLSPCQDHYESRHILIAGQEDEQHQEHCSNSSCLSNPEGFVEEASITRRPIEVLSCARQHDERSVNRKNPTYVWPAVSWSSCRSWATECGVSKRRQKIRVPPK